MSDGDNATPGQDGDTHDQTDGRPNRGHPASARAPWERVPVPQPGVPQPGDDGNRATGGNHSEGVAVADLIAKVTGATDITPVTRRSVDVTAPVDDATVPIPVADEIPDLAALARARRPHLAPGYSAPPLPPAPPLVPQAPPPVPPTPPRRPPVPPAGSAQPDQPRRRRPALIVGRVATALIAVLALAITGAAWQWQSAKNKLLNTVAALDPNSSDIRDPNGQIGDENFLIIGVDSRFGVNAEMGGDTDENGSLIEGARSDTIMLVNIPANRKRVVAVSFPRDLAIAPMNCQAWDPETGKYGPVYDRNSGEWSDNERQTTTKLNSAFALGGPKCLVKVIQRISGLAINRFMAVDFAGFSNMVDALGGVEVCSTTPLDDAELGPVLTTAGRQKLDGHTALNYVRARSIANEGNGDYGRIKRQQLFLSSLMRSLISSETLFDLDRLDEVVNTFIDDSYVDNVQTRDLVRLGQSLQGINAGRITFVTLPTTGIADAEGNEVPRTEDASRLFDAIIDDEPLPGENDLNETITPHTETKKTTTTSGSEISTSSTDSTTSTATSTTSTTSSAESTTTTTEEVKAVAADPRDVTVKVANGTERMGLATAATKEFDVYGFTVEEPDTSSDWGIVNSTTVYYSLGNEQAALTVAATLPGAQVERIDGLGEMIQIVLGPDFTAVRYPQASGTPLNMNVTHTGTSTPTRLPSDLTVINGADVSCE
jgi:LCP family protein required for cell wall assembly